MDLNVCEFCVSDENVGTCEICGTLQCAVCTANDIEQGISLNEWLYADTTCSKCKRTGCANCMNICHECANHSIDSPTMCKDCSTLVVIPCNYHTWSVCEECDAKKIPCGDCYTNSNYDGKHRM